MIGTVIDGEYRVLSCLGAGGSGTAYLCEEISLERTVVLKMLTSKTLSAAAIEAFLAEGRTLASLNHPNVVVIHRLGLHDGTPYIVMEHITGPTLRGFQTAQRPSLPAALTVMAQVAGGLAAIHRKGIVHRDLSANNVMITRDGVAKILDLGLSRSVLPRGTAEDETAPAGTIPYLAPEVIQGAPATFASDAFSFGILLYETLAGAHPFGGDHYLSMLANIVHAESAPIEVHRSDLPSELRSLVSACLRKDPRARLQDMKHVAETLRRVIATLDPGVVSGPVEPFLPARRFPASSNPYLNRVMIQRPEDFFGRTQEIRRIFTRLNINPPGSMAIVGDRRIGKSSLLNYVQLPAIRERHLARPERFIMIFVDFQERRGLALTSFIQLLLDGAGMELRGRIDISDCPPDLDGVKTLVQRLDRAGYKLALILDEFEAITQNREFNLEFYSFLRYLANHFNVAYLTSSTRDLQVLCHTREIADSPFFNIFTPMQLSAFKREEALELISVPSESVGKPLARYAEELLDLAGMFPFFLQIACSHAIEFLEEQPGRKELDLPDVARRFLQEAGPHFQHIRENLEPYERAVVSRLARRSEVPGSLKDVLEELGRRQYVLLDASRPRLFSSCFQKFVRTRPDALHRRFLVKRLFGRS